MSDPIYVLLVVLGKALRLYELIVVLAVVFSWLQLSPYHRGIGPVVRVCRALTEPLLAPLRDTLYRFLGGFPLRLDFSPIVLIMMLELVYQLLANLLLA